jgi:hypothetical protein
MDPSSDVMKEESGVPPPPYIFPNNMMQAQNSGLYPLTIAPPPLLLMAAGQTQRQNSAPALITAPNFFNPRTGIQASHSNPGSPVGMGPVLFVDTNVQSPTKKGGFYVQHFLQQEKKNSPRRRASSDPSVLPLSPVSGASNKVRKKRSCTRWTEDENKKLIEAYVKYEGKNWSAIAKAVGNKTSDQCNQHWHRVLNPAISKKPWTDEEDNQLVGRVNEYGESSWKKISEGLRGRTDLQCRHRWTQIKKTIQKGGKLSPSPSGSPIANKLHNDEYSSNSSSPTGTPNTPTPLSGRVPYVYGSQFKNDSPSPSQQIDPNTFYTDVPVSGYSYNTGPSNMQPHQSSTSQHLIGHPQGIMMMDDRTGKYSNSHYHQTTDRSTPLTNYEHDDMFLENPNQHHSHPQQTGYAGSLQETMEGNVVNFLKLDFFGNESQNQNQYYQHGSGLPPPSQMYGGGSNLRQTNQYIQPNQNRAPIQPGGGYQPPMYNSAFYPMSSAFDQHVLQENSNDNSTTPPPPLFPGTGNSNMGSLKSDEHSPLSSHVLDQNHMDFHSSMESFHQSSLFEQRMSPPTLPPLPSIATNEFGFPLQNTSGYAMRHHNE